MPVESKQWSKTMTKKPDQYGTENYAIPDILKVPEGHVLILRAYGTGVQKYTCPVSATSKAVPHAILLAGRGGDLVAIHFGGPTWQALDGSSVVGDGPNAKHYPAPDPADIDWLLIPTKSTTGNGQFSKVSFIQRLCTDGGQPPAQGCDKANNQTEVLVGYSAEYLFYAPAAKHGY
jgi:Protein of unknown function (DUF3455)